MTRKFILILIAGGLLLFWLFAVFQRKLPELISDAAKKELGREVTLEEAYFVLPAGVKIKNLMVLEAGDFEGEPSVFVEELVCQFRPLALVRGDIWIRYLGVRNAQVIIRKWRRNLFFPLKRAENRKAEFKPSQGERLPAGKDDPSVRKSNRFFVDMVKIMNVQVRFIDYDIAQDGFAIDAHRIEAEIRNISGRERGAPVRFDISAQVLQGRSQSPANFHCDGWVEAARWDMDMNCKIEELWMPHFTPYYQKITSARIDSGLVSLRSTTTIKNRDWNTNARAKVRRLEFGAYEVGDLLFGVDAVTFVNLLQNRSGELTLDLILRWDLKDPNMNFRTVLRKSIERSLKATFLVNIKNVVENTLDRIDEEGMDSIKDNLKDLFRKVRDAAK